MAPRGTNWVNRSAKSAVEIRLYVRFGRGVGDVVRGIQGIHGLRSAVLDGLGRGDWE